MSGSHWSVSGFVPRSTLVDTNLLLLFLVGTLDRQRITKFKRTQHFSERDFDLLLAFLQPVRRIVTTPHILTEVSNLAGQMEGKLLASFYALYARLVPRFEEVTRYAKDVVTTDTFTRLGLTDAVIAVVGGASIRVLTDDLPLAVVLKSRGVTVIPFDVLRNIAGLK